VRIFSGGGKEKEEQKEKEGWKRDVSNASYVIRKIQKY